MRPRLTWLSILGLFALLLLAGCREQEARFDGERALEHVETLCALGPRPVASQANEQGAQYITQQLTDLGWDVEPQEFMYLGVPVRNILATKGTGPLIILGTHMDTRSLADEDPQDRSVGVPGANDGTSGTAVLLELARTLSPEATEQATIQLAFFDAEDQGGLNGWGWCVGSQYAAANQEERPAYVLIVDMVGDADQEIYYEWTSSLWLQERVWSLADDLGYGQQFIEEHRYTILDDHSAYLQRGWSAALIIDMDYVYWHTTYDTPDKVSATSLERVGRVLETLLEGEPFAESPTWTSGLPLDQEETS